ncbi:DUF2075 domain-containing protein [Liquorilactobacillus capillatus]|uniref:Schlafen group 3-like DNA/RNA helicase domain-containing protein n=1 Tax=Liquorilactobacillus capillatus DSM 19910 TaxID=1423731 RepID=A0A0R1M328_9LACO|nr:DUF2075 domain-containing protein [Liquorilactobacillus capillatus]KRL02129.1 hypothetical protein FC81_GL000892 [Liquorilactobacillus capillatus DSM 19910]
MNRLANEALSKLLAVTPTTEQQDLEDRILNFCQKLLVRQERGVFIVSGDAGTGKSVILTALFNVLQQAARDKESSLHKTSNYLLVNHPEMLKLYKNIAAQQPVLLKKNFERPTTFINHLHKIHQEADIVLVDEAHLLLTKSDPYNHFKQNNQLQEIISLSKVVILVFDEKQVLKGKSYWTNRKLQLLTDSVNQVQHYHLTTQFRIKAEEDVNNWVKALVQKKILPLPAPQKFDFRIMDDAQAMYDLIKKRNSSVGLSRMLATYDFPYRLDGDDYFVNAGNFSLRWDRNQPQATLSWAERSDSIEEVGSVYTIQGFDLNYAGIILGPSVCYDKGHDCLKICSAAYQDQAAFNGLAKKKNAAQLKERLILNSLDVLLTRARYGMYIYATDAALRARLQQKN